MPRLIVSVSPESTDSDRLRFISKADIHTCFLLTLLFPRIKIERIADEYFNDTNYCW